MNLFEKKIKEITHQDLYAKSLETLLVNVGFRCNQECHHCHLVASPSRTETMTWKTMNQVLHATKSYSFTLIDITGGAPELNPFFTKFVSQLHKDKQQVQVRTNLTVLHDLGLEKMVNFFAEHTIQLVASLPCYEETEVRLQRGDGIFEKSLEALKALNDVGYGKDSSLVLNIMFNPLNPVLPPLQSELEKEYHHELLKNFGIQFTHVLTLTNMPLGRFLENLQQTKKEQEYRKLLYDSFNPETINCLMCRHQIEVGWDGTLYDCDFNLAIRQPVNTVSHHIDNFNTKDLTTRKIVTGLHCFGCTAGHGSSCGGSLL